MSTLILTSFTDSGSYWPTRKLSVHCPCPRYVNVNSSKSWIESSYHGSAILSS